MPDPPPRSPEYAPPRRNARAAERRRAPRRVSAMAMRSWVCDYVVAAAVGLAILASRNVAAQEAPPYRAPSRMQETDVAGFTQGAPAIFAPPHHEPAELSTTQLLDSSSIDVTGAPLVGGTPPVSLDIAVPGDCEPSLATPLPSEYGDDCWEWQILPDGLIYRSYLAGFKEPRLHSLWAYEEDLGWVWDIALGGRVGILRYGNHNDAMPDGWQIDLEGAGFPRLDPEEERDLVAVDFRAGVPITYGVGSHRTKIAYYHLSSHLGDEFLLKNPTVTRYNYSRDVLVLGQSYYVTPDWRIYAEGGWAFYSDVSGEWEFQFGVDYSPIVDWGLRGSPFVALAGHLREEVDFGGNLVVQAGWQWRQPRSGHLFRLGVEYFNGKSDQFEFFDRYENKIGLALWYDY
jgi:hypothetical protein